MAQYMANALPVVCLLEPVVPVAEPVELHPDDDADVVHHVLSVQFLPPCEADKMVSRNRRVLKACHHPRGGDKLPHPDDMVLGEKSCK